MQRKRNMPNLPRPRVVVSLAVAVVAAAATAVVALTTAHADTVACAGAWNPTSVYTGGMTASYQSHNYRAKWWTQNENPVTGNGTGVWEDQGGCGGGGTPPPTSGSTAGSGSTGGTGCAQAAAWAAGHAYRTGDIVRYTDGNL